MDGQISIIVSDVTLLPSMTFISKMLKISPQWDRKVTRANHKLQFSLVHILSMAFQTARKTT